LFACALLKTNEDELATLWLTNQLINVLKDEKFADEALKSVTKKIKKDK